MSEDTLFMTPDDQRHFTGYVKAQQRALELRQEVTQVKKSLRDAEEAADELEFLELEKEDDDNPAALLHPIFMNESSTCMMYVERAAAQQRLATRRKYLRKFCQQLEQQLELVRSHSHTSRNFLNQRFKNALYFVDNEN